MDTAERLLNEALATLRMLTPEGWERAWAIAVTERNWHTVDTARIKEARLLAMRAGGRRFDDPAYGRVYPGARS